MRDRAYRDRPLPIGYGQTISQPFIVALMTDLLDVGPGDTVLEIGTGSGYQAAVLSPLGGRGLLDRDRAGARRARRRRRSRALGYANVEIRVGDGYYGWPEHAPFDGIVVTAAASHIPPPLVEQLTPGGRMVIPVGGAFATQQLMLVEKRRGRRRSRPGSCCRCASCRSPAPVRPAARRASRRCEPLAAAGGRSLISAAILAYEVLLMRLLSIVRGTISPT